MKMVKAFLCLAILICITPLVIADTTSINLYGSTSVSETLTADGNNVGLYYVDSFRTENIQNLGTLRYVYMDVPIAMWGSTASTASSKWESVTFKVGTQTIGTGHIGFLKGATYYHVLAIIDGFDRGSLTGDQVIDMVGISDFIQIKGPSTNTGITSYALYKPSNDIPVFICKDKDTDSMVSRNGIKVKYSNSFDETYNIEYTSTSDLLNLTINRPYTSKILVNDGNVDLINETSLKTDTPKTVKSTDVTNYTWDITIENTYGYSRTITIFFDVLLTSVGTINLNQSSYTEPELVQIEVELDNYDFIDHSYYIITEVSEDLDYWDNIAGTYNGTTKITTTTATRILDVDTWLYDLPIWIRSRLVDYNKLTGEYTTLDTTPAVLFNPPIPDSIKFGGTVIDADTNQIISGALVSVEGVTTTSDTTNAFGEFLMYIYPGIYTVTASKTGYQTYTSEELLMEVDNTWAQIYLTPIGYGNGTLYGNVNDANTGYAIKDVHVIITNATDQIDAYTSSGGYYEATGLAQSSTYTIQAVKSGYYTYNGSVTTEASGASHKSFNMVPETATPTPTATVLPTSTYPGGEGHEWTNDEIVTMLRVLVPSFFMLMLIFLFLAVIMGVSGNNGGNGGQGRSGLGELWRR